ncbi:MAG: hypothetical protein BWY76_00674 [bacterium ADurb.Bin429]|nr:MAG: hypothetical protein BWY76_00674 [bacterium ADurb.Bin429]
MFVKQKFVMNVPILLLSSKSDSLLTWPAYRATPRERDCCGEFTPKLVIRYHVKSHSIDRCSSCQSAAVAAEEAEDERRVGGEFGVGGVKEGQEAGED